MTDHNEKQQQNRDVREPCVIALGNFDGVHIGHRALIEQGLSVARPKGLAFAVLLFVPHPQTVLRPERRFCCLTDLEEKKRILYALGADKVLIYPFTKDFAALSPEDFVEKTLMPLKPAHVVVGYNYTFGQYARGSGEDLVQIGKKQGFTVDIVPEKRIDGMRVSSTDIRQALDQGKVETAALMLGRPYRLQGCVVTGCRRGRELGFPTANLQVKEEAVVPGNGVYAGHVVWQGKQWNALINIGSNPTFAKSPSANNPAADKPSAADKPAVADKPAADGSREGLRIEVHILDFSEDLYGEILAVDFLIRIRSEKKFETGEHLVQQIRLDVETAQRYF
jgi:riboflavin kinase/FMN adenylyltransferase